MEVETVLIIVGAVVGAVIVAYLLGLYVQWTVSAIVRWIREEWDKGGKKDDGEGT